MNPALGSMSKVRGYLDGIDRRDREELERQIHQMQEVAARCDLAYVEVPSLAEAFEYDPVTGIITHGMRRKGVKLGADARYWDKSKGRYTVHFSGKRYQAEKVAWALLASGLEASDQERLWPCAVVTKNRDNSDLSASNLYPEVYAELGITFISGSVRKRKHKTGYGYEAVAPLKKLEGGVSDSVVMECATKERALECSYLYRATLLKGLGFHPYLIPKWLQDSAELAEREAHYDSFSEPESPGFLSSKSQEASKPFTKVTIKKRKVRLS
ncbi:hypothetical protein N9359_04505 [Luminiphilus sp.]|nr:hypothetical protein [Luminiphilus sp.]